MCPRRQQVPAPSGTLGDDLCEVSEQMVCGKVPTQHFSVIMLSARQSDDVRTRYLVTPLALGGQ